MKQKITLLAAALFTFGLHLSAQHVELGNDGLHHCGTDQHMANVFAQNPALKAEFESNQAKAEEEDRIAAQQRTQQSGARLGQEQTAQSTYVIPIVFHIIHDYGSENISDAQILDQMRILNEDFNMLNSDLSLVVAGFQGVIGNPSIEFRLANIDPNGACTNGIDRIASVETYIGDDGSKLNYWPRNKYLNIWVVKTISSGAAGYAYLPGGAPSSSVDGIIILQNYIGSIGTGNSATARALTHEIGHFLNLSHVWGNSNNPGVTCGNDGVSDTPETKGWTTCNLTSNDVCNNNIEENVQNFMEYSYCSRMFTALQAVRVSNALNSGSGQRNQLHTPSNLIATGTNGAPVSCAPIADFGPADKIMICAGGSATFSDISFNGNVTTWNWTCPGGTPSSSTDSMPVIQYNTPGVYNVTLVASNSIGSSTKVRTGHVIVSSNTAQYANWQYTESVENSSAFSSDWVIMNPQGNGWARVTTAAYTGAASAKISNTSSMTGQVDEMISPSIDMTAISAPTLTFRVAFAQRTSTNTDRLRVFVSTNCGQTWSQRYTKTGATLSTHAATNTSYTPTVAEWRMETVTLSSFQSASNLRIKFEFTSDGGNNIYLDDINVSGVNGIDSPESGIQQFSVYPNPTQDNTTVAFGLDNQSEVQISVVDMAGREVMNVYSGVLSAGTHSFPLNTAGTLSSGIYFVRMSTGEGRAVTQKLIVE
jgi:PKD repeat protein